MLLINIALAYPKEGKKFKKFKKHKANTCMFMYSG
jgi:hypothetical protein